MVFIACGLNHKTAPLDVRETLSLSADQQKSLLNAAIDVPHLNEMVILSTCNRTEVYCDLSDPALLIPWLATYYHCAVDDLSPYMYMYTEQDALKHALRVAAGLDSMMLGEPQIFGQIKQAFQDADQQGTIGPCLRSIFSFLFGACKRIRNQSGVGQHATSIAYAASQLIRQRFPNPEHITVLLIGSGETSSLVAKYLHQQGVRRFMMTSRTQDRATDLATLYAGKIIPITALHSALANADVIVSATACPLPFISESMVSDALRDRHSAPMFLLDLAVPRDIDPKVGLLPHCDLYNIDDLDRLTTAGKQQRQTAADHAESLVAFEVDYFMQQHRAERAKDLICDYRSTMQAQADMEVQRAMQKLVSGQDQLAVFTEFSQRLIKKFTHAPTLGLRQAAMDQRDEILDLAHYLFHSTQATYEDLS